MRKFRFIVVSLLIISSLAGCDMFAWRTYRNREYKVSFIVPKDWDIDEDVSNAILSIKIPRQGPDEVFGSSVMLVAEDLPSPIELSTYYDMNREEFKQVFKKMGNIEEGQGMSGLNRYQWISFVSPLNDDMLMKAISVVWMKGKRVFVLTCVMDLKRSLQIEPLFRKLLASFRIN